jgi:DnaJ-class molecular chaperone
MLLRRNYPSFCKYFQSNSFVIHKFVQNFSTAPKICLYKILNVSTDASPEQLKKSYLELAKKYHPDVSSGEKIQEVTNSFSLLQILGKI